MRSFTKLSRKEVYIPKVYILRRKKWFSGKRKLNLEKFFPGKIDGFSRFKKAKKSGFDDRNLVDSTR